MFEELKKLGDAQKAFSKELCDKGKVLVKLGLNEFFDKHPEVYAVRWTQFPPYFNDGEACVFSVHEPCVQFSKDDDWMGEYGESLVPSEKYNPEEFAKLSKEDFKIRKSVESDLSEFYNCLYSISDALETAFGEHAQVTATRDGIEVEEYTDHD